MMECRNIDELMMEFIYRELEPAKADEFRTHVGGCARCNAELGSLQATRQALRELPELEPSPMVTTRLLEEAARRQTKAVAVVPVGESEGGGLLAWLGSLFRPIAAHPAFAAVAALVLVGGVAGFLTLKGKVKSDYRAAAEPTRNAERVAATPPQATQPAQPTGGALQEDGFADKADQAERDEAKLHIAKGKNMPAAAEPNAQAEQEIGRTGRQASPDEEQTARGGVGGAGASAGGESGKDDDGDVPAAKKPAPAAKKDYDAKPDPEPAPPREDATLEGTNDQRKEKKSPERSKSGEKQPAVTVTKDEPKAPPKDPAKAVRETDAEDEEVAGESAGDDAGSGDPGDADGAQVPAQPTSVQRGQQADVTNAKKKAKSKDEPGKLHGQARAKAASGNCSAVSDIKKRIYRTNPDYYQRRVRHDPDLAKCDAPSKSNKKPTRSAPRPADSTRDAESPDKSGK